MRRTRWPLFGALALATCQPGSETVDRAVGTQVELQDVHVVPTPDVLARIVDVAPGNDGRVWVLNSVEPFFVLLQTDGQVVRSFGDRGGGPNEFDDPIKLVRGPDGSTWTFDNLRKSFRSISNPQTPELALPTDWQLVSFENAGMGMVATAPWLHSQGGDFLVARKRPSSPPSGGLGIWHADVYAVAMGPQGLTVERSLAVPDLVADPSERWPGATLLVPYPLWAACAAGGFGLYDPLANTLRRLTSDGEEEPAFALGEERNLEVTFDHLFGMVYRLYSELRPGGQAPDSLQMRTALQQQFEQVEGAFADDFPAYADLQCVDDGSFWLQPHVVRDGRFARSSAWTRFGTDGSRTTISLPEGFTVHRIENDRIWGTVVDTLGLPSVAWLTVQQ